MNIKGMNYEDTLAEIKYQLKDVDGYDIVYQDSVPVTLLQACQEALEN